MALSAGLNHFLNFESSGEPLAKRLKLAENVFCSPDLPIVHKEECIFQWLTSELSSQNANKIWFSICRCLALEPKSFFRLSVQTKSVLIEKIIAAFNNYPAKNSFEEILRCCIYIFSSANAHAYLKENYIVSLIQTILKFTIEIIDNISKTNSTFICTELVLECAEKAVGSFTQICRQNFSETKNFASIFIENIFFPLSLLIKNLKSKEITSKLFIENEKCIKKLLISEIKNFSSINELDGKTIESDNLFSILKKKIRGQQLKDIVAPFEYLFESVVTIYQHNSVLIDIIFRKIVNCFRHVKKSRQILIILLEKSIDLSYNFDNEVEGVTLETFLKSYIEEIIYKTNTLGIVDYNLMTVIARLNPLIVEDFMESILTRILFEIRNTRREKQIYDRLMEELWKASVRLRRQHKFLSKFLIILRNLNYISITHLQFDLPKNFITEFSEDLKSKTTSAQVLAIFQTLNFHLKSDCIEKLLEPSKNNKVSTYLYIKVISKLFTLFFEYSNFLDFTLPYDWQVKFYQIFIDLKKNIEVFTSVICEKVHISEPMVFIAYVNLIKIWCEVYNLLKYYMPNIITVELEFLISNDQLKIIGGGSFQYNHSEECIKYINQLFLLKYLVYKKGEQKQLKARVISALCSEIIESHFEIINVLNENQTLQVANSLVVEATSTKKNLEKWELFFKKNVPEISNVFVAAVMFEILKNIVIDIERSITKKIVEKIKFEDILRSCDKLNKNDNLYEKVKMEISQQSVESINEFDLEKIKKNVLFLSKLPLTYLSKPIRIFLFLILYTLEKEISKVKKWISTIYSDLLRHNDIDILCIISKPSNLVYHFRNDSEILTKIFKLALVGSPVLTFFDELIDHIVCDRKIKCILLNCIDQSKSKVWSNEQKTYLHDLSQKLCSITEEFDCEVNCSNSIAGLRICLKIILSENKELKSNLKRCIDLTLKNIIQMDSKELTQNTKIVMESLHLSLIVLSQRDYFNIDDNIVDKLCITFINNPDTKIFSRFLEVLKDNEFDFFAKSLSNITKQSLINGDETDLKKLVIIWESLSKVEAKVVRSKILCLAVNNLLSDLLCSEIKENSTEYLLKIFRAFVTSKRMIKLTDKLVDFIFVASTQFLKTLKIETKLTVYQDALGLCLDFVRQRSQFIVDKLPILDNLFRMIFIMILRKMKEINFTEDHILRILAIDIEKYCTFFAKLKKYVARISPYLIADLIEATSSTGVLPSYLKVSFESSVCQLLSNCDRHAISFLFRTLPASSQQVFKTIYDNYTKYHKFTGKI